MKRTEVWIDECAVRVREEEFPFDDGDALPDAFARALEVTPPGGPIELRLGDAWVQRRRLPGLPPVGARDLRCLVAEEPNRYFRRRPGGLVVDARWDGEADPPEARAAAVEHAVLDVLEASTESAGRVVLRISPADGDGSDLTFDTPGLRAVRKRWALRKAGRWVAAAAAVWLVA